MDVNLGELLVREARYRVANDMAVAVGVVRLALGGGGASAAALAAAAERLEVAVEVNAALCREPAGGVVDVAAALGDLRRPLARMAAIAGWAVEFELSPVAIAGVAASRIGMIVHELVSNSLRHGDRAAGGVVLVRVRGGGGIATICVRDGGRPRAWTRGGGQGGRIVDALAASLGGVVRRGEEAGGGVKVVLPAVACRAPALPTLADRGSRAVAGAVR